MIEHKKDKRSKEIVVANILKRNLRIEYIFKQGQILSFSFTMI